MINRSCTHMKAKNHMTKLPTNLISYKLIKYYYRIFLATCCLHLPFYLATLIILKCGRRRNSSGKRKKEERRNGERKEGENEKRIQSAPSMVAIHDKTASSWWPSYDLW